MITPNKKIPSFETFLIEKQGVAEREVYQETDEFRISEISNNFINHILEYPDDDYIVHEVILDSAISINYLPNEGETGGKADSGRDVCLYDRISNQNFLHIKYMLVHELVHIIQHKTSKTNIVDDLSPLEQLKIALLKVTSDNIKESESILFTYLVYREDIKEIHAWNHQAYITSFKYKMDNPNASNSEIIKHTLDKIKLSSNALFIAKHEAKKYDTSFDLIISVLIGHFFELKKGGHHQVFFDKDIFKLDVVKKMRKEMKDIIHNNSDINDMVLSTVDMMSKYRDELEVHHRFITDSFIKHLEYWFKFAQKRAGKAISLGIEDATME